ncbi:MAG: sugar phosphate isomerase/epimerase [Abditibacteriales bacterium]|nr:sugar phosphate isomerase/epimerase [Abditibacteriales bacterium]MDW8365793.1 sugar phosphate isomerase/epimerase family protein [Abditibacteriales bacterium]
MEQMPIGLMVHVTDEVKTALDKVQALGIPTAQILFVVEDWLDRSKWAKAAEQLQSHAVKVTAMFVGFAEESYADIPTIREHVGLVPDKYRDARTEKILVMSDFAKTLGIKELAAHIGFVPEDRDSPTYKAVRDAMRKICDYIYDNDQQVFALETGQETARALHGFIHDCNRMNLGVNFDPANMILYGSGNPIEALDLLGHHLLSVHCKDGKWPQQPGTLGTEFPLGEGEVGIENYIAKLKEVGYTGPLTIEREISGEQQLRDIARAKELLERLR